MIAENSTAVLEAIKIFWAEKGYGPSIRNIMEATDISSTSIVHYHILKLAREGIIKRTPGVARSYILMEREMKDEIRLIVEKDREEALPRWEDELPF